MSNHKTSPNIVSKADVLKHPLWPYLFILGVEILGILVRINPLIKGIDIGCFEYKIGQFADDSQLYLNESPSSLRKTIHTLDIFRDISGLRINKEKTKTIGLRPLANTMAEMYVCVCVCVCV